MKNNFQIKTVTKNGKFMQIKKAKRFLFFIFYDKM